jgi:hypothetical protein
MSTRPYLVVSGLIFALVAVLHLLRALAGWRFAFGPWDIPTFGSWVGFILGAALALWALRLSRR